MAVGSAGEASWTADQDYVLDSVTWDGQGSGTFASLSQIPSFDAGGNLGSGIKVLEEFVLGFTGLAQLQILLDYPVTRGSAFYLNCLASGVNVTLDMHTAE